MEKKEFCKDVKVEKVLISDYENKVVLFLNLPENIKAKHINKDKLEEDNKVKIKGNQVLFCDNVSGDETAIKILEALQTFCVGFRMKDYIYNSLYRNSIINLDVIHAQKDEIDEESGTKYENEAYSYRLTKIILPQIPEFALNVLIKDINEGTIKAPKTTSAPAPASNIFAGLANIKL